MSNSTSGISTKMLVSLGAGIGVTAVSSASYLYYKYWKQDVMPEEWQRVGILEMLEFFPLKSGAPLKMPEDTELECEVLGLRYESVRDRALMLVDSNNLMLTARGYPKMVLIASKLVTPTKLEINAPGMETLELDFSKLINEAPGIDIHTSVFGAPLDAMLCGEKYDRWFSQYILSQENGVKLVYYPYPKPTKPIDKDLAKEPHIKKYDTGAFADATSYMLMNLSSIEDLNKRLPRPVQPIQFRGGFYLKMDKNEPYAEDSYDWIKIGQQAVFRKVAPCRRCILPNINPETGERDPDNNPLKTLKTYRCFEKNPSPVLGIHLGLREPGKVKRGDVIYIGIKK
ncbi:mitochondrial amidoxime-reducing component 1-like [Rhagoletis pomonella]|uniref:mitochondrial amidoxime-reducing component 1-like n=1 Tax=Rhagoletis pomonella TaxID=28610 RepID=UPI00177B3664|nr:mitochondrial amidoxime-reducing component 1-like [Rhagoletis pomonella]